MGCCCPGVVVEVVPLVEVVPEVVVPVVVVVDDVEVDVVVVFTQPSDLYSAISLAWV